MPVFYAEYIWIDGGDPNGQDKTRHLRSKTKIIRADAPPTEPEDFPEWSFDGSSTNQAPGDNSDCVLRPVRVVADPVRPTYEYSDGGISADVPAGFLVLCEVFNADGTPHETNTRAALREVLEAGGDGEDIWIAFEQEYTLYKGSKPLGFPENSRFPPAQGPYYCGVGCDEVYGRDLVESHLHACLTADLYVTGINAEVMPGQWEFQVGGPDGDPLTVCDHLWLARWLLYRIGEDYDIYATLDQKPVNGDWNGAGMHTNVSTTSTREDGGMEAIARICDAIGDRVDEHLAVYGDGLKNRLTGAHETCAWNEFKWGVSDRTASIRIPYHTNKDGKGYFEDRRPGANADPYEVSRVITEAILIAG